MVRAVRFGLAAAPRRFFASSSRRLAKTPSQARQGRPKPLEYAPQQQQQPYRHADVYPNPDSLSPANPYGGAGGGGPHRQYNSTARRITLAMVAAPIAIVTSYVLWQRLVLGQKQKKLVHGEQNATPVTMEGLADTGVADASAETAAQTGPQRGG